MKEGRERWVWGQEVVREGFTEKVTWSTADEVAGALGEVGRGLYRCLGLEGEW